MKDYNWSHSAYFFLVNPQFLFFGKPSYLLQESEMRGHALVDSWIAEIEEEFDLILILENLEDSLALFVLKYCWDVKDVANIKLNAMKTSKHSLTDEDIYRLGAFNWADYRLYNYFKDRLQRQLAEYDPEEIQRVKKGIAYESKRLADDCLRSKKSRRDSTDLVNLKLRNNKNENQTCFLATDQDRIVTHSQIRQILKWKKQYPEWRMHDPKSGNDVPGLCSKHKDYRNILSEDESEKVAGFWDFHRFETNEYDVRPKNSHFVQEIIDAHTVKETHNINFIFNNESRTSNPDVF